jgi:hypothetical protein
MISEPPKIQVTSMNHLIIQHWSTLGDQGGSIRLVQPYHSLKAFFHPRNPETAGLHQVRCRVTGKTFLIMQRERARPFRLFPKNSVRSWTAES